MTGIKLTHVPYRGTAPALNDLIGGYIQLMFSDLGPALPLINAGKTARAGGDDDNSASPRCPTFRRSPRPACPASTRPPGKA